MSDDLLLPQVPESKPEDPEDVSWALSTAEAMWARGDHSEGIKWVRRAAEAASEAENDNRALELAKAAADLTGLITRRTNRSIDLEEVTPAAPAAPPPVPGGPPPPPTSSKPAAPAAAPATSASVPPKPIAKQLTPSRPPAAPVQARISAPPPPSKRPPAGTESKAPASIKPGAASPLRPAQGKKSSRRSRENLDAEARAALKTTDTARLASLDSSPESVDLTDTAETVAIQVPHRRRSRPELGSNDPTVVGTVEEIVQSGSGGTDEWQAPPTSPTGVAKADAKVDLRMTVQSRAGRGNTAPSSATAVKAGPATAKPVQHDPAIQTSQAVRVIVWRDANGVHVAPAGTVVSAITVDAMLVALEPSADLTAWLSGVAPDKDTQRR